VKPPQLSVRRQLVNKKGWALVSGFEDVAPLGVLLADFSELRYRNGRKKAHLMPIVDQRTKWVLGWSVGRQRDTESAGEALAMAQRELEEMGLSLEGRTTHQAKIRSTPGSLAVPAAGDGEGAGVVLGARGEGEHGDGVVL